jgi:hypothetical protein
VLINILLLVTYQLSFIFYQKRNQILDYILIEEIFYTIINKDDSDIVQWYIEKLNHKLTYDPKDLTLFSLPKNK